MPKVKHVMLDLETLSTDSNALILQVGAVHFDIHTGGYLDSCLYNLNVIEQLLAVNHAVIEDDTIKWWRQQSVSAKFSLSTPTPTDIEKFMLKFNEFVLKDTGTTYSEVHLWGNGATFDNVILRNLYKRNNMEFPVPFYNDRDLRTILSYQATTKQIEFVGERHISTNDCIYQIDKLVSALKSKRSFK